MQIKLIRIGLLSSVVAASAPAAFVNGDLAVVRINGAASKTVDTTGSVSIDVYSPNGSGGYTLSSTHAIDSTGPGLFTLTRNTSTHDGLLRQSSDGQYLTLAGYRAAVGSASFTATSAAAPRVVARIDGSYTVDTSTVMSVDYNQTAVQAAVSRDGSGFWISGSGTLQDVAGNDGGPSANGGLRYIPFGGSTATHVDQQTVGGTAIADSARSALIAGGQLYVTTASAGSYGNRGLYSIGTGLPTGGTNTVASVITNNEGVSTALDSDGTGKAFPKTDCVLLDLNPAIPGVDTAYSTGGKADYEKWIKDANGVWQNVFQKGFTNGTVDVGNINTLTAAVNNGLVTLLAATGSGVYQMADAFGYSTNTTPTLGITPLFSAAAGTQFRGLVALVPEPMSAVVGIGVAGMMLRRKR